MIKANDVCLLYKDGTKALLNINLNIGQGEIVYITGPSGSGKTSLLKLLMGIEYPTSGHLTVFNQPIIKDQDSKIRYMRRKIGPVFQEFRLIPGRTAFENVTMGIRFLKFSPWEIKENAKNALEKVGLGQKTNSLVENLSWGEGQRVAIARAMARKPSLVLADEPTGNLDKDNSLKILELLHSYRNENTTVVITTHATHLLENMKEGLFIKVDKGTITCERLGKIYNE